MPYFLGVDLGGTYTAAGIVNERGALLIKDSIPTDKRNPRAVCDCIAQLAEALPARAGIPGSELVRVGVGSPGIVCNGVVVYASNLEFENTPLQSMLEDRLDMPVRLQNDGNAAAFGELAAGAGRGFASLVALTIGTGVGSGIVLDSKIHSGFNGGAGELGHTVIVANGRTCSCGKAGCLEAYCSATALKAITREVMAGDKNSLLWTLCGGSPDKVSARTAFEAMRGGDPAGRGIVEDFLFHLSLGVSNAINLIQPEVFCIGGGVSKEGDAIILPLRELVRGQTYMKREDMRPRICAAKLGNDAGIIGAALM